MFLYKLHFSHKRWKHQKHVQGSALQALYEQRPQTGKTPFNKTRFIVIDCEMSGLDPKKEELLSIGWVTIENGRILNSTAKHILIHSDTGAGQSTKIHGLHDSVIGGAKSIASALVLLISHIKNSVVVFHHAPIDIAFLQTAAKNCFHHPLLFSYIDTMVIEQRRIALQGKHDSIRLAESRKRYGLPETRQHNALTDAIATAELFLAQSSYLFPTHSTPICQLPIQSS